MKADEIWKPVEGFEDLLEVSSFGNVRTKTRESVVYSRKRLGITQGNFTQIRPGKVLSPWVSKTGYKTISVMIDGKRPKFLVHRLVALAFVEGFFAGAVVDHKDGNKLNNLPSNLEWVTLSENTKRQWDMGLVDLKGELHPNAKLSNLQANAIALLYKNNFPPSQLAAWFNISTALVYQISTGSKRIKTLDSRYTTSKKATEAA